jgi:rhodanese-related sulfurtransferase
MATQVTINDPVKAYFEAKMAFTTGPVELERMMKNNEVNVVDVRAAEDYAEGHIPGAINLPTDQWQALKGLRRDKLNGLYCYSQACHLAATATVDFAGKGYPGMQSWTRLAAKQRRNRSRCKRWHACFNAWAA